MEAIATPVSESFSYPSVSKPYRSPYVMSKPMSTDSSPLSTPGSSITVLVRLFAAYQEACGVSELTLTFPAGTPVIAIAEQLQAQHPELTQWHDLTRYGLNLDFVPPETILQDGDEVVLIPPVSGG
jgi:sulfur-carrier protein